MVLLVIGYGGEDRKLLTGSRAVYKRSLSHFVVKIMVCIVRKGMYLYGGGRAGQ